MAIVYSSLPSPNFVFLAPKQVSFKNISSSIHCLNHKQDFPLSAMGVKYSERELTAHGVTFSDLGDGCVLKLSLENGTAASLMLPTGLITSFRPQMWHGGTTELLHTSVSQGENEFDAIIQGGLSLSLVCENDLGASWSPNIWTFNRVKGSPQESIQVELITQGHIGEVRHIVTLWHDHLTSEIVVTNSTTSSFRLTGSVISHLAVSTPDATYALGLQGSDYFVRPPFVGDFTIVPPGFDKTSDPDSGKAWAFDKLFSKWNSRNQSDDYDVEEALEGEEEDDYKQLTEKFSRIYTSTPRNLTIMDRGRRNSVNVRRDGFTEMYMLSPGSEHEMFSKYSYICIGHAALLEPILVNAQSAWRGGLQLWNPNS